MIKDNIHKLSKKKMFKCLQHSRLSFNMLFTLFIFFALWASSFGIGRFISSYILKNIVDENLYLSLRRILTCGFQISTFLIWVKCIEKRKISTLGFKNNRKLFKFIVGFLIGISAITIITIALFLAGAIQLEISKNINPNMNTYGGVSLIILGWIIQSASEEISIRGWLIPHLGSRYNVAIAILTTSVVFGILHLFVPSATVLSFVNLILSGIFFALYAINEDSLWGVWGCHFGWNLALANIFSYNVSGFSSIGYSVLKTKIVGNSILTGGSFGPEGGLLATLVLIIGIIIRSIRIKGGLMIEIKEIWDE